MEKSIEELKQEANELGITYSPNIGAAKLQAKIDEFYEADMKSADIAMPVEDTVEEVVPLKVVKQTPEQVENKRIETLRAEARRVIAQQRKDNGTSVVVKVTMVDKRESSTATDAYFNNGEYATRIPLDTWVEMPKILAEMADSAKAQIHVQIGDTSVPKMTKKYVVEYKK